MSGFIYNGFSTAEILPSSELSLVSTVGAIESVPGVTRQIMGGEPTISRPIINEYGTVADHLEFSYSLTKSNDTLFTDEEQIAVERWLTSPKYSLPLIVFDCNGTSKYKYYGLFTSTEWMIGGDGYVAVTFTFSVNGSYAYEHHKYIVSPPEDSPTDVNQNPIWEFEYDCITDELDEWVYPKVTIADTHEIIEEVVPDDSPGGGSTTTISLPATFRLANATDGNRAMVLDLSTVQEGIIVFDCKNCMISGDEGNITFKDLGWDDVGNIYWLRLKPGKNVINVIGNVEITIEYDSPVKIAGGWLI